MFCISEPPCEYRDPWNQSFEERFRNLCVGKIRVAYFYERPDTSTFRYRIFNMIQVLTTLDSDISAAYFCNDDVANFKKVVDNSDIIVICRMRYDEALNQMITHAHAQGKKVFFDIDDMVFDISYTHLIMRTLAQELNNPGAWDHWFAYIGRIGTALKMCDGGITTNSYLAKRMEEFAGFPVKIVPNFMNQQQLEISDRIFEEKMKSGFARTNDIHLGYFSGTPTHTHDFHMMGSALTSIMLDDPRVKLLVVGFLEMGAELEPVRDRIEFYGLHDFINLQRVMSLVEINLVPLRDNGFTNCKSELKYFEAAAVGTLSVATPIHSYATAIQEGKTGFLARSTNWEEKIRLMMDNIDNMGNYNKMADDAHDNVMQSYCWFNMLPVIKNAIF